tara:strand:- start:15 stop:404 length:390 start_codon:yes stop_codon:yes gene_type:complete
MNLHHIGFVFEKNKQSYFDKKYKNKIIDHKQQNFIYFDYNKKFSIWFEYLIPINRLSTVFKFSNKINNKPHHFGFWVNDIKKETKKMISNNYILINKFKIKVPVFGGSVNTVFFYKEKKIIELISGDKK